MLARSRKHLGSAIDAPGPATYAPWQGCAVPTDDFLVLRLMEIVVHADDLACSVGIATPAFGAEVLEPVLALLAALAAASGPRRGAARPQPPRALSRTRLGILTAGVTDRYRRASDSKRLAAGIVSNPGQFVAGRKGGLRR